MKQTHEQKLERLEKANAMIKAIASCGREFFRHEATVARLEISPRGRVWLYDEYTGARIDTHLSWRWRGFNHGGTMRRLIEAMRDYIFHGTLLPRGIFGPFPQWMAGGDLWGYGADMEKVRAAAAKLGIVSDTVEAEPVKAGAEA